MPRTRPPYPPEFRRQMVELVRAGRSPEELAADLDEGRRSDGLTTDERAELRRLRRETKQLRMEREILKKAAAWFARESGSIPGRDSSS